MVGAYHNMNDIVQRPAPPVRCLNIAFVHMWDYSPPASKSSIRRLYLFDSLDIRKVVNCLFKVVGFLWEGVDLDSQDLLK